VLVGASFASLNGFWNILVLASFIALAGAGKGLVVLTGGIDLSIPWVITLSGVLVSGWTNGDNGALPWVVPAVLGIAVVVGVINGLGVVALGISPVVFTIAINVILEGVVLVLTDGTPKGEAPPMLKQLMHDRAGGIPLIAFVLVVLAGRTTADLERVAAAITGRGGRAAVVTADVAGPGGADAMVSTALTAFGRITALVNNAGIAGPTKRLEDITAEEWSEVILVEKVRRLAEKRGAMVVFGHDEEMVHSGELRLAPAYYE
jgi:ABC-type xylose transport system permease subunit